MPTDSPTTSPVIAAWSELSNNGTTRYEVILRANGLLSCECAGWTVPFKKKGAPPINIFDRSCAHTKRVRAREDLNAILQGSPRRVTLQGTQAVGPQRFAPITTIDEGGPVRRITWEEEE